MILATSYHFSVAALAGRSEKCPSGMWSIVSWLQRFLELHIAVSVRFHELRVATGGPEIAVVNMVTADVRSSK